MVRGQSASSGDGMKRTVGQVGKLSGCLRGVKRWAGMRATKVVIDDGVLDWWNNVVVCASRGSTVSLLTQRKRFAKQI